MGGFKEWRADLRPVDEPERRLVVVDGTDGPLLYAKAGVKAGKREPSTGTSKDVIVNVLRPSPRFAPRATPAILIADRSAEPIGDVLRREGYGQLIDGWRAIYNARVQQCDRMPLFEPRSLTEAARRGWRIEVHGGIAFAVSEAAERFETSSARARSARAAKVMQHTTTATVPQGATGLRSKALRMPIHVSPALP